MKFTFIWYDGTVSNLNLNLNLYVFVGVGGVIVDNLKYPRNVYTAEELVLTDIYLTCFMIGARDHIYIYIFNIYYKFCHILSSFSPLNKY